jgi:hypothetical protein
MNLFPPGIHKTSVNLRGNQSAGPSDEILTSIALLERSVKDYTLVLPVALTKAQLKDFFANAPVVTGSKAITASGCAGWATLDATDKAVLTGKGYTLN